MEDGEGEIVPRPVQGVSAYRHLLGRMPPPVEERVYARGHPWLSPTKMRRASLRVVDSLH